MPAQPSSRRSVIAAATASASGSGVLAAAQPDEPALQLRAVSLEMELQPEQVGPGRERLRLTSGGESERRETRRR